MSLNPPPHSAWAKRSKPRLPAEIESMVLDTFQDLHRPEDLTWLWLGGRHVSKHFRCEIERIFRTILLSETILHCDLGLHLLCWDIFIPHLSNRHDGCHTDESSMRGYRDGTPCFDLDRFSDDQTRAFFACGDHEARTDIVFRRLHEKRLVGAPVFSIQIREVVNDTGLPGLQIDDEKEEISFDWKGMVDQLLGEEHVFNTILSQRLGWHLDPGEDMPDLLETHRKLARRSRLQRECRAKYRSNILDHYTHDETEALKNIQKLRLAASGFQNAHDGDDNDKKNLYTKQKILDELPDDVTIYSGNINPGPKPASIPRGILTNRDYCWPVNQGKTLPPPSAVDLFTPRPLPDLSMGRRPIKRLQRSKREHRPNHGKRAREGNLGMLPEKRSKTAADRGKEDR